MSDYFSATDESADRQRTELLRDYAARPWQNPATLDLSVLVGALVVVVGLIAWAVLL